MDYPIALPPDLGLSPADFVDAWNDTPACRAVAEAHLVESTGTQYDPALLAATFAVLGSVAASFAGSVLNDCIKQALAKKGVR